MDEGTTLYVPDPGTSYDSHLWMIISDPKKNSDKVLIVDFTSWEEWKDQACIVNPEEHPYVRKKTCVNYRDAKLVALSALIALEKGGKLRTHAHLSPELLEKIRAGVLDSQMKLTHAQVLIDQGLVEDL